MAASMRSWTCATACRCPRCGTAISGGGWVVGWMGHWGKAASHLVCTAAPCRHRPLPQQPALGRRARCSSSPGTAHLPCKPAAAPLPEHACCACPCHPHHPHPQPLTRPPPPACSRVLVRLELQCRVLQALELALADNNLVQVRQCPPPPSSLLSPLRSAVSPAS